MCTKQIFVNPGFVSRPDPYTSPRGGVCPGIGRLPDTVPDFEANILHMKQFIITGLALLVTGATAVHAQSSGLGINFASTDPDATTSSLLPSEMAGVIPQANWNNLEGASGEATGLFYDVGGSAVSSTVTVSWSSPNTWRSGANNLFVGPDQKLLSGYLDTGNTTETGISIVVENLDPALAGEGYDVYVYFVSDSAADRGGGYVLDPGSGPIVKYGSTLGSPFEFVEDPGTDPDLSVDGTHLRFTGLTGDSFTLITDTTLTTPNGFRAPINAIQIVPTVPFGPEVVTHPSNVSVYEGASARLVASLDGFPAVTDVQWLKDGVAVEDSDRVEGANTTTLMINEVNSEDAGNYSLSATSPRGSVTSDSATLRVVTLDGSDYEAALVGIGPRTLYRLNEESTELTAFDYVGGLAGTYGDTVQRGSGVAGPRSPSFPGFSAANSAAFFDGFSHATVPTPQLNTDTATFIAWIQPTMPQLDFAGLFMSRGATAAGIGYTTDNQLGYTWNNNTTWSWNSGLRPPDGEWSMVALVIQPERATLYLGAGGSISAAINPVPHIAEAWGGNARIGGDAGGDLRDFMGHIDEITIVDRALSFQEVADLYEVATGVAQVIPPSISPQPQSTTRYAGATVQFRSGAAGADFTLQWRRGSTLLEDDDRIDGANTDTLTIQNITSEDAGDYTLLASNAAGDSISAVATLTVLAPENEYVSGLVALNPLSYYRLNESGDVTAGSLAALDAWGGRNGTWGIASLNSMPGPGPLTGQMGFEESNTALQTSLSLADSWVTVPGPGVTTDTLTLLAWIYPNTLAANAGIVFARAGQPATGINLSGAGQLGYHWLDAAATYNFASGLTPPLNEWSLVALVVEPTQATLHMINSGGTQSAVNPATHAPREFSDTLRIGGDPNSVDRTFDGLIDEVALFGAALTPSQIQGLYQSVLGDAAPIIGNQPQSLERFPGVTVQMTVGASGSEPLFYQWQREAGGTYGNLEDEDGISGTTSATLTLTGVMASDAGSYRVLVSNAWGEVVSESATLTVLPAPPIPVAGSFGAAVLGSGAAAYWRLNESDNPSLGTVQVYDHAGVSHGVYGSQAWNASMGIAGPRPFDGFSQFEEDNFALMTQPSVDNSWVTVPGPGFTTDTLTVLAWINPLSLVPNAGIVFARAGQPATGLNLNGDGNIGYHWLDAGTSWGWNSGLTPPIGVWSLVALVVEPNQVTAHLLNAEGTQSNSNPATHAARAFIDNIRIGGDPTNVNRNFDGSIDEVAIFNRALSPADIQAIFAGEAASAPPFVTIEHVNGQIHIHWDQPGTLQATLALEGEWTEWVDVSTEGNTYTTDADGPEMFFRVVQ